MGSVLCWLVPGPEIASTMAFINSLWFCSVLQKESQKGWASAKENCKRKGNLCYKSLQLQKHYCKQAPTSRFCVWCWKYWVSMLHPSLPTCYFCYATAEWCVFLTSPTQNYGKQDLQFYAEYLIIRNRWSALSMNISFFIDSLYYLYFLHPDSLVSIL